MDERKDKYIVDRIEDGKIVVCEFEGEFFNFDISLFPQNVREGDVYVLGESSFELDNASKEAIKKRILDKTKRIFK